MTLLKIASTQNKGGEKMVDKLLYIMKEIYKDKFTFFCLSGSAVLVLIQIATVVFD